MRASRFAYRLLRVRRLLSHSARISGRLDLQPVPEKDDELFETVRLLEGAGHDKASVHVLEDKEHVLIVDVVPDDVDEFARDLDGAVLERGAAQLTGGDGHRRQGPGVTEDLSSGDKGDGMVTVGFALHVAGKNGDVPGLEVSDASAAERDGRLAVSGAVAVERDSDFGAKSHVIMQILHLNMSISLPCLT